MWRHPAAGPAASMVGVLALVFAALPWPGGAMPLIAGAHAAQQQQQPELTQGQRVVVWQRGKYYYATVERLFSERGATMLGYRWTSGHQQGRGTLPLAQASGRSVFTLEQAGERGFQIANTLPDEPAARGGATTTAAPGGRPSGAAAVTPASNVANGLSAAEQSQLVAAHNRWRQKVGVPDLSWSSKLAQGAQDWAEHIRQTRNCSIDESAHTDRNDVGENLAWRSPVRFTSGRTEFQQATPADITDSWGSEQKNYDHASNRCHSVCGHYTQIVWRSTEQVGCGRAVCERDKSQVWVCRYAPPGNYVGQKPY